MNLTPLGQVLSARPSQPAEAVHVTPSLEARLESVGLVGLTNEQARAKLKELAHAMEAVFLNQLFQAMRASVPREGSVSASSAEEMFTAMLDEQLAREATRHIERGIGDALYRQLTKRLPPDGAASP